MQPVTRANFEAGLLALDCLPGDPRAGFHGPGSMIWKVNRESAVFLGAGRAALLQIAHPWVAAALAHHSNLLNDALGRFHGTFRVVYTMVFGDRAQALAAARGLYLRHAPVQGELPGGGRYQANEVEALVWVWATLIDSAVLAYDLALPPLTAEERDGYYAEGRGIAGLFGIPADALPSDWAGFQAYMAATLPTLRVDAGGRALGASVLSGAGTWVHPPAWYRALTAGWLPEHLRAAFGLTWGVPERRSVRRVRAVLPRVYPRLPGALRFVGPWHEARARLRGREPGWWVRRGNAFWMGCERMPRPD